MNEITVCIPVFNEEKTISTVISSVLSQSRNQNIHILLVASGCTDQTIPIINGLIKDGHSLSLLVEDERRGKASALNLAFSYLREIESEYIIFTDGDVLIDDFVIEEILKTYLEYPELSIITGHPIPLNPPSSIWGKIAEENCTVWDLTRKQLMTTRKVWPISGYLFSLRYNAIPKKIPLGCVVEDAFIGLNAMESNLQLGYAPNAFVKVQFPTNIKDYYHQKSRTRTGWYQISLLSPKEFKFLNKLQQSILRTRIQRGKKISLICWLIDKIIWNLDLIFTRRQKNRQLWAVAKSTKKLPESKINE